MSQSPDVATIRVNVWRAATCVVEKGILDCRMEICPKSEDDFCQLSSKRFHLSVRWQVVKFDFLENLPSHELLEQL